MRAFRIPAALMVVASIALVGCGDLTGPSVEAAPQFQDADPGDQGQNGEQGDKGQNGEQGDQGNGEQGDQG